MTMPVLTQAQYAEAQKEAAKVGAAIKKRLDAKPRLDGKPRTGLGVATLRATFGDDLTDREIEGIHRVFGERGMTDSEPIAEWLERRRNRLNTEAAPAPRTDAADEPRVVCRRASEIAGI